MHDRLMGILHHAVIIAFDMNVDGGGASGAPAIEPGQGNCLHAVGGRPVHGADNIFGIARGADGEQHVAGAGRGTKLINETICVGDVVGDGGDWSLLLGPQYGT